MSTLRKKVFSRASVKCFSFYDSNYSDLLVFGNAPFGEIKDQCLRMRPFQKTIAMEVLSLCVPYIKRYFQKHQWSPFFFIAEINLYGSFEFVCTLHKRVFEKLFFLSLKQIRFYGFLECSFWRDQRSRFENDTFLKKLAMKVLGMCPRYVKRYFKSTSEVVLSLWLKLPRFCCLRECGFWWDQRLQFEKEVFFKKNLVLKF